VKPAADGKSTDKSASADDDSIEDTASFKENKAAEKVSVGKKAKDLYEDYGANMYPEKVHTLEPGVYQARST